MSERVEVTDEMVERLAGALLRNAGIHVSHKEVCAALDAALNQPPKPKYPPMLVAAAKAANATWQFIGRSDWDYLDEKEQAARIDAFAAGLRALRIPSDDFVLGRAIGVGGACGIHSKDWNAAIDRLTGDA